MTTLGNRRTRLKIGIGAATLLVLAAANVALFLYLAHGKRKLAADYQAHSAALRDRDYPRDPDTPGWALLPGDAADDYAAAVDGCPYGSAERSALSRSLRVTAGPAAQPSTRWGPLSPPGSQPIPASCQALWRDELPDEELRRLLDEIAYVRRDSLSMADLVEGAYLVDGSMWVADEDVDIPPSVTGLFDGQDLGPVEDLPYQLWDHDVLDDWSTLIAIQEEPYPVRQAFYDRSGGESSTRPLSSIHLDWQRYDAMLTRHDARMRMLHIAVADAVYRRETGHPASNLDELSHRFPDLPRVDPLTDEPLELFADDGRRFVASPARDPEREEQLGLIPPASTYDIGPIVIQLALPREDLDNPIK